MTTKPNLRPLLPDAAIEMIAARFKVLGEPNRLRLLNALRTGERTVTELVRETGSTQPNVSRHLQALADAGLVQRRREGVAAYYTIADPQVFALCELVCGGLEKRLRRQAEDAMSLRRRLV